MKGLLLCRLGLAPWMVEITEKHPLLFPLPGSTLLEHQVQTLRSQGAEDIRILTDYPGEDLEKALEPFPGVTLRYFLPHENTLLLLNEQRLFLENQEALLIQGPSFHPASWFSPEPVPSEWVRMLGDHGVLQATRIRPQGTLEYHEEMSTLSLSSPSGFFRLIQNLLPWSQPPFHDPVFSTPRVSIRPPVFSAVGNRVEADTILGPGTWLDRGTKLGKGSELVETLVIGGVHLPAKTQMNRKIVTSTHIIHGETGEIMLLPQFFHKS